MGVRIPYYPSAPVLECQTMKSPSPEHWSKDFVEHLRSVHFALVTVSAGLLLLLSSKSYDAKAAASQMSEVANITSMLSSNLSLPASPEIPRSNNVHAPLDFESTGSWFVGRTAGETLGGPIFGFHVVEPNLFLCEAGAPPASFYHHIEPPMVPNTMRDFALWWDALADRELVIDSIGHLETIGRVKSEYDQSVDTVRIEGPTVSLPTAIHLTISSRCDDEAVRQSKEIQLRGTSGNYIFTFKVVSVRRQLFSQRRFHEQFGNVTFGPFYKSFSALANATKGREGEQLGTIASQIYAEAAKGNEAFEAFGVKFPSEQVTGWGMIALIGVQVYMVMYLKLLSNKLRPDDPGWDVPWMAMDQSMIARIMLFVSLVFLPTCTALLVMVQAALQVSDSWTWRIVNIFKSLEKTDRAELLLMLVGFCASVTLSILSWKYRPKLTEPSASAQLFE